MRSGAHKRIAAYIGHICGLDTQEMERGSIYPDKVATSLYRSNNPYRIDLGYPHHKDTVERLRNLILQLRKDRIKGRIDPFYLGVLTHFIADKWCYPSDRGYLHQEFEKRLEDVKIDSKWAHVGIMDASILDTIPYNYPCLDGREPSESEAMKGAFQESLTAVKSIISDIYPPQEYYDYYIESKKSIKENSTLYWLLTYLHPLFLLTFILQIDILAENDPVKRYIKIKERSAITNLFLGIFGCIIALGSPIFWLSILPLIGYFIAQKIKINDKLIKNIDWYTWNYPTTHTIKYTWNYPTTHTIKESIASERLKICPKCGYKNLEDAIFCQNCGTKLKSQRTCPECGTPNTQNAKFCQNCGKKLEINRKEIKVSNENTNLKTRQALKTLTNSLKDKDWRVRFRAAWALGELNDPRAFEPLIEALKDKNEKVRKAAFAALENLEKINPEWRDTEEAKRAVTKNIEALKDEEGLVRGSAAQALRMLKDPRAVEPLTEALKDKNLSVRFAAAAALGELGDPRAVELLIEALKDKDLRVRFEAALALGVSEDPRAVGPLIEAALKDEEGLVRAAAAWALRRMDPEGKVFKFI